jgi:hypothetical protein
MHKLPAAVLGQSYGLAKKDDFRSITAKNAD